MVHNHPLKSFREGQEPPLSQADLAKLLGVENVTVWRWEAGKRQISERHLPNVAAKTGIPKEKLRPDLAALMQPDEQAAE